MTILIALFVLAASAALVLVCHYGLWQLLTLICSWLAAYFQARAEWANLMRDASNERKRLFRQYLAASMRETGCKW